MFLGDPSRPLICKLASSVSPRPYYTSLTLSITRHRSFSIGSEECCIAQIIRRHGSARVARPGGNPGGAATKGGRPGHLLAPRAFRNAVTKLTERTSPATPSLTTLDQDLRNLPSSLAASSAKIQAVGS